MMDWFPQQHADEFFVTVGFIGLVAVIVLVVHMLRSWDEFDPIKGECGQRLRYLALFAGAVLLAAAAVEQVDDNAQVELRNVGALVFAVLVLAAAIRSMLEAHRRANTPRLERRR